MKYFISVTLFCGLISSCGTDKDKDKEGFKGDEKSSATQNNSPEPIKSLAVISSSIPACEAKNKDQLIFVKDLALFKSCSGTAWEDIDLGVQKKSESLVASTINCSATTTTAPSGIIVDYNATIFKSGDVWASAEISATGLDTIANSLFYSSKQQGALTASITIAADVVSPYTTYGWWEISVNRETKITTAIYHDGGDTIFSFPASACSIQTY